MNNANRPNNGKYITKVVIVRIHLIILSIYVIGFTIIKGSTVTSQN